MTAVEKLALSHVLSFFEYEKVRGERRRRVIALKERRRVSVGPYLSFAFENRETLLFQVQEMCRVERITDEAKVQDELDVYNSLLPGMRELSATVFIEIADKAQIQPVLDCFMGIDVGRHVWLEVGRDTIVPAEFEAGHSDEEPGKISAVHFARFRLSAEAVRAFRTETVSLVVDHPAERSRVELSSSTKAALGEDLAE